MRGGRRRRRRVGCLGRFGRGVKSMRDIKSSRRNFRRSRRNGLRVNRRTIRSGNWGNTGFSNFNTAKMCQNEARWSEDDLLACKSRIFTRIQSKRQQKSTPQNRLAFPSSQIIRTSAENKTKSRRRHYISSRHNSRLSSPTTVVESVLC